MRERVLTIALEALFYRFYIHPFALEPFAHPSCIEQTVQQFAPALVIGAAGITSLRRFVVASAPH